MRTATKEVFQAYRDVFGESLVLLADDKFGLASWEDQPEPGRCTFATLGLSESDEFLQPSGAPLHQELLMVLRTVDCTPKMAVEALTRLAEHSREHGVRRSGELHRLDRPFLPAVSGITDVYVVRSKSGSEAPPARAGSRSSAPPVSIVLPSVVLRLVVPLLSEEAAFVEARGWKRFERMMVDAEGDFTDLRRTVVPAIRATRGRR